MTTTKGTSATRDAILGAAKVRTEMVEIPELNTSVEMHGITAGARGRLINSARDENGKLDYERYYALLVIESARDPETHELLFKPADYEAVNALPSHIVERLSAVAESLSGAGAAYAVLEKNSEATGNVATGSDSHAN